jgi:hypothetical protein
MQQCKLYHALRSICLASHKPLCVRPSVDAKLQSPAYRNGLPSAFLRSLKVNRQARSQRLKRFSQEMLGNPAQDRQTAGELEAV